MFMLHVLVAWRNLTKNPGYTLLNLGGLALGIAAAFVLGLYVQQELTYDASFEDNDRIYRVATDFYGMGGFANSQAQLFDVLPDEAAAVEQMTRLGGQFSPLPVFVEGRRFEESDVLFADPHVFEVFSYRFMSGNRDEALAAQDGLVVTEEAAERLFGTVDALDRVMLVGKERTPHRVTGVVEAPAGRTHLAADVWLPLVLEEPATAWTNVTYFNYLKLRPGATQADLEAGLANVLRRHAFPAAPFDGTFEEWIATPHAVEFFAQPLRDIYLHSDYNFELSPGGSPTQVYALGIIGILILLIAGVNYVNLTTARSAVRAKEIGVKKTMGAAQGTLVRQFLSETIMFSLLAAAFAAVVTEVMLAAFRYTTGETLVDGLFSDVRYPLFLLVFSVAVGVLAGLYPAVYLSRFRPVRALRGGRTGRGNQRLRGVLVVGQFAVAIVLVVGSLVVARQLAFMQEADKGLTQEGVLFVNNAGVLGEQAEVFRRQVDQLPQVERTSLASRVPTSSSVAMTTYQTPEMEEAMTLQSFEGDESYIPTLGMRLLAGRTFSQDLASDSSAVILNEAAVAALGLGSDPLGQEVNEGEQVIGVVADFHFQSFHERVQPAALVYGDGGRALAVRLSGQDTAGFVEQMQALWQALAPDDPIRYSFLDENFAAMAVQERALGRAVSFFTALALIIAALGLLGLATFAVQQRTKEIGVRKVLGATVPSVLTLLSKDFLRLVLIAFVVATPLAYLAVGRWLDEFAYHVDLGPRPFLLAGAFAFVIAFLTVSTQALRAATADPVRALRSE